MEERESFLTAEDIANHLKIAVSTAYSLINKGYLPSVKIRKSVRVDPQDYYPYLEKMKKRAIGITA